MFQDLKILILSTIFILFHTPGFSQDILAALRLKKELIGEYPVGEFTATDTIVDLNNGYYEEFLSFAAGDTTIIKQAAIFRNHDGSTTLGMSITEYDFVCFLDKTSFYQIPKSKDSIYTISTDDILPHLSIREFVAATQITSVLNKYLPAAQENDLDAAVTINDALSEIYHIAYRLPQRGTSLTATLMFCDHVPSYLANMTPDDWSILENDFVSIELAYDKTRKQFKKTLSKK